jgi:putative nucleotidyltransferase with HDIG domain
MLGAGENRKLRRLYQFLMLPETAAAALKLPTALTTRANFFMASLQHSETDGSVSISPKRVSIKTRATAPALRGIAVYRRVPGDTLVAAYAGILAIALAGLSVGLVTQGWALGPPLPIAALAALAFYAERQCVRVSSTTELSVSFLPLVFAAVVFGPLAAMTVGALGLLGEFRAPYVRWLTWTLVRAGVGAIAGLSAMTVHSLGGKGFGWLLLTVAVAATANGVADVALSGVAPVLRRTGSFTKVSRTVLPVLAATIPLYTPIIAVLAYAYVFISPWTVALFLLPATAAQRLFIMYREQRETAEQLAVANEQLERAGLSFAGALVATLDARDRYTAGHSAAVAVYSRDIARRMGLGESEQQLVYLAGLVHDIGKIGLPPGLLEKPGPLTLDERRVMEEHSVIGERILSRVENYAEIAMVVRHHHERVDGHGYPDGLHADEIPLLARIISVADAYNAMTSDRPYREAMPSRVARLRLAQAVESQFDTAVVAAFEALLAGAAESYRMGEQLGVGVARREVEPTLAVIGMAS